MMAIRRIVYTRPDGGLSVVTPVRNTFPTPETGMSDSDIEQRAWHQLPADAINPRFLDAGQLPQDRTYRGAWKVNGSGIDHDMPKAREIHRDRLRVMRAPLLQALDIEALRHLGNPEKLDEIEAKKQVLRDVTADASIEAADTTDELKAAVPAVLRGGVLLMGKI